MVADGGSRNPNTHPNARRDEKRGNTGGGGTAANNQARSVPKRKQTMPIIEGTQDYYTPVEVATICRVTRRTVYEWIRSGQLPAVKHGPKLWRIKHSVLSAWASGRDIELYIPHIPPRIPRPEPEPLEPPEPEPLEPPRKFRPMEIRPGRNQKQEKKRRR